MGVEAVAASAALQVGSGLVKGIGTATGYQFQEEKAQRQARAARTAADQTDAAMRDELNTTLGNIMAIQAAAGLDPSSPTALAILQHEQEVSERQRRIKVGNLMAQAGQSETDASYYRYAAGMALPTEALGGIAGATRTLAARG